MCLYEVKQIDYCSRMRYSPKNNYIIAMLEAMEGMRYLQVLRCYSVRLCSVSKALEVWALYALCAGVALGEKTAVGATCT